MMAKELKRYSLYLLAIVGIVAVVGIVLMVSGKWSCFGAGSGSETEETLLAEEEGDIAGKAIQKATYCYDNDAKAADPYIVMSSVKYGPTSNKLTTVLDSCKTISGKTYLFEGTCYNGKFVQIQKNCAELNIGKSGADYKCVNGACVGTCTPQVLSSKCVKYEFNQGYTYEVVKQQSDCSIIKLQDYCPPSVLNPLCDDNKGCCHTKVYDMYCEGDVIKNITMNTCTLTKGGNDIECKGTSTCGYDYLSSTNPTCVFDGTKGEIVNKSCQKSPSVEGPIFIQQKTKEDTGDDTGITYLTYDYCYDVDCNSDKGCCRFDLQGFPYCEGDILKNTTKNPCTGEVKTNSVDCKFLVEFYVPGEGYKTIDSFYNTCKTFGFYSGCFVDCDLGDVIYIYLDNAPTSASNYLKFTSKSGYLKYTCVHQYFFGNAWKYSELKDSNYFIYLEPDCPKGATCYYP
jgi:hypothetical protein